MALASVGSILIWLSDMRTAGIRNDELERLKVQDEYEAKKREGR